MEVIISIIQKLEINWRHIQYEIFQAYKIFSLQNVNLNFLTFFFQTSNYQSIYIN